MFQCPPNMKAIFSKLPGWSNLVSTAKTVKKEMGCLGPLGFPWPPQLPHIHPNRLPSGMEGERLQPLRSLAHTSLAHSPQMVSTSRPKNDPTLCTEPCNSVSSLLPSTPFCSFFPFQGCGNGERKQSSSEVGRGKWRAERQRK